MDSRARAQELIEAVAGDIGIEGMDFDEAGLIDLHIADGLILTLACLPAETALLLVGNVGGPLELLDRPTILALLAHNADELATTGATMAVEPGTGHVVLQRRLDLTTLDYAAFTAALQAFMAAQESWSSRLTETTGQPSAAGHSPVWSGLDPSLLNIRA